MNARRVFTISIWHLFIATLFIGLQTSLIQAEPPEGLYKSQRDSGGRRSVNDFSDAKFEHTLAPVGMTDRGPVAQSPKTERRDKGETTQREAKNNNGLSTEKPSQKLMDTFEAAIKYEGSFTDFMDMGSPPKMHAVDAFMKEALGDNLTNANIDGHLEVNRVLQNPYQKQIIEVSIQKGGEREYSVTMKGDLTGLNKLDIVVNSGLTKTPEGPSKTEAVFKGYNQSDLKNARATFTIKPDGFALSKVEAKAGYFSGWKMVTPTSR